MRRFAALVMVLCFLALGSGSVEFLHNQAHAREDAANELTGLASSHSSEHSDSNHAPLHDESNCQLHAMLHAPLAAVTQAAVLICRGPVVAVVAVATPIFLSLRVPLRLDCRGPPAF
jgi:hypothetical protein